MKQQLNINYFHCRSVTMKKASDIAERLVHQDIDMCLLTETWFKHDQDDLVTRSLEPDGYKLVQIGRNSREGDDRRGGGVGIVHKKSLRLSRQTSNTFSSFEHIEVLLKTGTECVRLCVLYRPPDGSVAQFLEDFTEYVDSHTTTSGKLVMVGDFNFWWGEDDNYNACRFRNTLTSLGLHQSVREHTREKHTLDMIVTRANENGLIRAIKVSPIWFSDHFYIAFRMQAKKPRCQKKILTVRNLKNINMEEVADDITQSVLLTNTPTDLDDLVHCYNTTLSQTLDKHAPATTKEVIH